MNYFRKTIAYSTLIVTALAGPAWADSHGTTRTAAEDAKWLETGFGPWASPVAGDFSKGKHMTMIKFAPGMKTPVHVHTGSYDGVVVQGEWKHFEVGKPETETVLGPGSFWSVSGNTQHISECVSTTECIAVIAQEAPFDYTPVK